MSSDERPMILGLDLNSVNDITDAVDNILVFSHSTLPFLEGKKEFIVLLVGTLCAFLVFLILSVLSEQITAFSSILFSLLFTIISYTNIIVGRLYKQSIKHTSQILEAEA